MSDRDLALFRSMALRAECRDAVRGALNSYSVDCNAGGSVGKRGINPHNWFYEFGAALAERSEDVCGVLHGSAAEQWVNAELCAYLARTLPKNLYAVPEYKKRDVSVFRVVGDDHNDDITEAVIETKLVYATYSLGKIEHYTKTLCQQMKAVRSKVKKENGGTEPLVIGLLLGVWAKWPTRFGRRIRRGYSDVRAFRRVAGRRVREAAKATGNISAAKNTLETLVPHRKRGAADVQVVSVCNGNEAIDVALVGQYLRLRTTTTR